MPGMDSRMDFLTGRRQDWIQEDEQANTEPTGIPQGSALSLYLIFDSECVEICSNPTSRMAFVDDVNILVCGDSTAENCRASMKSAPGQNGAPDKYKPIHFANTKRKDLEEYVHSAGDSPHSCPSLVPRSV